MLKTESMFKLSLTNITKARAQTQALMGYFLKLSLNMDLFFSKYFEKGFCSNYVENGPKAGFQKGSMELRTCPLDVSPLACVSDLPWRLVAAQHPPPYPEALKFHVKCNFYEIS